MVHQLAQVNIARLLEPLDSPRLADFVAGLGPINALADVGPGFVWRLQDEDGDATSIRAFDDEAMIVNLTVWSSLETLADFTFRSDHRGFLRRRRDWFSAPTEVAVALWWVPEGHRPDPSEAKERLARLAADGPTADAFTFRHPYSPPP